MTDLEKIELAIRRAAAQMPNHASRQFRLLADEIWSIINSKDEIQERKALFNHRTNANAGD